MQAKLSNANEFRQDFKTVFKYTIEIPVTTEDKKQFTLREDNDPYHPVQVAENMARTIENYLRKYTLINPPRQFDDWLTEILENSYDAYAKLGLTLNNHLQFKVEIKKHQGTYQVNIKDNAGGFRDKKIGQPFTIAEICPEGKNEDYFIGGAGVGLSNLAQFFSRNNATLFFKNRKKEKGACVSMVFSPSN